LGIDVGVGISMMQMSLFVVWKWKDFVQELLFVGGHDATGGRCHNQKGVVSIFDPVLKRYVLAQEFAGRDARPIWNCS